MNQKKLAGIIEKHNHENDQKRIPLKVRLNLYDIDDLCQILKVSRSTIARLRAKIDFPPEEKHSNKIYWKIEDIRAFLLKNNM